MSGYREHDARVYIEIAEKKLRICDKYAVEEPRMYRKLIAGESTFSVGRQDESGNYEQCSWAVMEALYNRKQSEPDLDIGEIFQQALMDEFAETISPVRLKNCVDCLLYQLNSEAQKTAPFAVDVPLLAEALRANILRNADRYAAFGILDDLADCDRRLFSLCGMHMMEEIPKNEQGSSDEGQARAASKGAVRKRKTRVWRGVQTAVVCIGMIALAAAIAVRQPLWIWVCLGMGIACMLPSVVSIVTTKRAKKARKEERTARKKWADAMLIAAAVCAAAAYGVAIVLKLLVGYACHIPNALGIVLIALIGTMILAYGLYDILVREKKQNIQAEVPEKPLQGDRLKHNLSDAMNTKRQPSAKPVPPVRVNREARDADPLGYPIPFKRLMIYPNWTFKIQAQTVALHHLQWQAGGKRHESEVLLNEAENVLYRVEHWSDEHDPKRSYTSTIRAQLAFDVKPEHHLPLVEWIMSLQTDPLREYADCVTVEDKTVRTWEDKYERILKHSEMREPVEYQTGWNCTYSDIGLNYRGQPTLFLERTWLDVPSRVPYNVYIEMQLNPENRSADHAELCALMESMVFSDPNEADKLMAQFRSWLNVDALREREEAYAASVQANPMGVESRILNDVQKQIALLKKAEQ